MVAGPGGRMKAAATMTWRSWPMMGWKGYTNDGVRNHETACRLRDKLTPLYVR